jgi:hypothetical protein
MLRFMLENQFMGILVEMIYLAASQWYDIFVTSISFGY